MADVPAMALLKAWLTQRPPNAVGYKHSNDLTDGLLDWNGMHS